MSASDRKPRPSPKLTEAGRKDQAARDERLARQLRENLKKRKAQARGRDGGSKGGGPGAGA